MINPRGDGLSVSLSLEIFFPFLNVQISEMKKKLTNWLSKPMRGDESLQKMKVLFKKNVNMMEISY